MQRTDNLSSKKNAVASKEILTDNAKPVDDKEKSLQKSTTKDISTIDILKNTQDRQGIKPFPPVQSQVRSVQLQIPEFLKYR